MGTDICLIVLQAVSAGSLEIAQKDPHGLIMTVTSISVVFCALFILYLCYSLIGYLSNQDWTALARRFRKSSGTSSEVSSDVTSQVVSGAVLRKDGGQEVTAGEIPAPVVAAIAMALRQHGRDSGQSAVQEYPHDEESYVLTIRRSGKPSSWRKLNYINNQHIL